MREGIRENRIAVMGAAIEAEGNGGGVIGILNELLEDGGSLGVVQQNLTMRRVRSTVWPKSSRKIDSGAGDAIFSDESVEEIGAFYGVQLCITDDVAVAMVLVLGFDLICLADRERASLPTYGGDEGDDGGDFRGGDDVEGSGGADLLAPAVEEEVCDGEEHAEDDNVAKQREEVCFFLLVNREVKWASPSSPGPSPFNMWVVWAGGLKAPLLSGPNK